MNRITSILLAAATAVFLLPPAESRDLFVSKTGDDSTGESWEASFNTICQALSEVDPGDAVHVAAGVYIESVTIPVGVSLLGGHPPYSSGSIVYNRNPRVHTTIIGATEELSAIRVRHNSVLDGVTVLGRVFQQFEGPPGTRNRTTIRTCNIYCEHPSINVPAISAGGNDLRMEECFVRYSTEQPSHFLHIGGECRIVNTIFSFSLPAESIPMMFLSDGPFYFFHCVFYDRSESDRDSLVGASGTASSRGFTLWIRNSISNQRIRHLSARTSYAYSIFKDAIILPGFNRDVDPQFVNPEGDDFRLLVTSPAIDSTSLPGPTNAGIINHDFLGRPGVVDIPGVGGTGDYSVDIGAYEMQLDEYRLRSDLNGDGGVDAQDLLIFSQDWHIGTGP